MAESPHVLNITTKDFPVVVLEGSHKQPVLVDFWADWCAPCRMLAPILTKLAEEYRDKLVVAKVNTEEERDLAARYGIRSLPTVQLFRAGTPVDQFMGALPESQIRAFLDRNIPRDSDHLLDQAEALAAREQTDGAAALIAQALAADPGYPRAILADAHLKAATGRVEEAEEALRQLSPDEQSKPGVAALRGRLGFAAVAAKAPPAEALERTLTETPDNGEARYQLAARRVMEGNYEQALELLLELMRIDRRWGDDAGRKGMLQIFEILGGSGDLVSRFRSRLFTAMH